MTQLFSDSVTQSSPTLTGAAPGGLGRLDVPIDGRARSLSVLSALVRADDQLGVEIADTVATRALAALCVDGRAPHLDGVIEKGERVDAVRCAPLDRMINPAEADAILVNLRTVLADGRFTSGPFSEAVEAALGQHLEVAQVVGTSSGTDALVGALLAVGVGPGTEVIIPPNSFPGTENAVLLTGAEPVLADIGSDHLLSPAAVRAAITRRTRCVLPVHLYGRMCDMRALAEICVPHGIAIVEDAAQGVGLDNLGRWSDCAALSFNPYKNLGACGKAGAVLTNNAAIADAARSYLYHGFAHVDGVGYRKYHKTGSFGLNARMDNTQAGALLARMEWLAANNLRRRLLAQRYRAELEPLRQYGISLPEPVVDHVWHLYTIEVEASSRSAIMAAMSERGIETDIYYPVLTHRQPNNVARSRYAGADVPTAERLGDRILQLPLYPSMTLVEQDLVVSALAQAVSR